MFQTTSSFQTTCIIIYIQSQPEYTLFKFKSKMCKLSKILSIVRTSRKVYKNNEKECHTCFFNNGVNIKTADVHWLLANVWLMIKNYEIQFKVHLGDKNILKKFLSEDSEMSTFM